MDVRPISNTQSVQELNSQSVELQRQKVNLQGVHDLQEKDKIPSNQKEKLSPEFIEKVVEELKKKLSMLNTQLKIQIDKDTDTIVVKVIDKETKKIIRQIPPEYILKIAKYLDEIAGILLNEKA